MKKILTAIWDYPYSLLSLIGSDLGSGFCRSAFRTAWMVLPRAVRSAICIAELSRTTQTELQGVDSRGAFSIGLVYRMIGWQLFAEVSTRVLGLSVEKVNTMNIYLAPKNRYQLIIGDSLRANCSIAVKCL